MSESLTASEVETSPHSASAVHRVRPRPGVREWENPNLERFLEAPPGFLTYLDGYYANRGQQPHARPDWARSLPALIAATGYE
jgi:hypothetical protein